MNYLAHFLLANGNHDLPVGALLGDYLKGPLCNQHSRGILSGVRPPRKIDLWCDWHPTIAKLKNTLPREQHRYRLLEQYDNLAYCKKVLAHIGTRISRAKPLHLSVRALHPHYDYVQGSCGEIYLGVSLDVAKWRTSTQCP